MRPLEKCRNTKKGSKARERGCIVRMEEKEAGMLPVSSSEQRMC